MATDEDYPRDLPILVIEAQIFVAVKKFPFLPNKQITSVDVPVSWCGLCWCDQCAGCGLLVSGHGGECRSDCLLVAE